MIAILPPDVGLSFYFPRVGKAIATSTTTSPLTTPTTQSGSSKPPKPPREAKLIVGSIHFLVRSKCPCRALLETVNAAKYAKLEEYWRDADGP